MPNKTQISHTRVPISKLRRLFNNSRAAVDAVSDYHASRPVEKECFDRGSLDPAYDSVFLEACVIVDKEAEFWRLVNTIQVLLEPDGTLWCAEGSDYSDDPDTIVQELLLSGTTYIMSNHVRKAQKNLKKLRQRMEER